MADNSNDMTKKELLVKLNEIYEEENQVLSGISRHVAIVGQIPAPGGTA